MDEQPLEWNLSVGKGSNRLFEGFKYKGDIFAKSANNTASLVTISDQELSTKLDAEITWIKGKYRLRKSSRESGYYQPVNRETFSLQVFYLRNLKNSTQNCIINLYLSTCLQ